MIVNINYRVNVDKRAKITSGRKSEKGYPQSLDYFNIDAFPELQSCYGNKPNKLILFFPSDTITDFFDCNYVLYGNDTKLRQCNGEECIHRIKETVGGRTYEAGDVSECVCIGLDEADKQKCKYSMYLKAYIMDININKVDNPLCYMFHTSSKNTGDNIYSELEKIKSLNMGVLRGVPFILEVQMVGGKDDAKKKFPIWTIHAYGKLSEIRERTEFALGFSNNQNLLNQPDNKLLNEPQSRNYTAEANKCKTLDELRDWYLSLSKDEQKKYQALKNNRKEEIERETTEIEVKSGDIDVRSVINSLTAKDFKNEKSLNAVENLIDKSDAKSELIELFNKKAVELKVDYKYQGLPF